MRSLLNQSSTKIQETQYYYDDLGFGNVGAGNLTKQDDWISGSDLCDDTQNTYNSYGLVTQTLDPRNNTTTYTYDAYNLYPATTTNALSQSTELPIRLFDRKSHADDRSEPSRLPNASMTAWAVRSKCCSQIK